MSRINLGEEDYSRQLEKLTARIENLQQESQPHNYALVRLNSDIVQSNYFFLHAEEIEWGTRATLSGFEAIMADPMEETAKKMLLFSHSGPIEKVQKEAIFYNIAAKKMQRGSPVLL